jgi:hypothetical protein
MQQNSVAFLFKIGVTVTKGKPNGKLYTTSTCPTTYKASKEQDLFFHRTICNQKLKLNASEEE